MNNNNQKTSATTCTIPTAVGCLAQLAREQGVPQTAETIQRYVLRDDHYELSELLYLASQIGFTAQQHTLEWKQLLNLQQAYPVMAVLNNGNCVLVYQPTQTQADAVEVFDPCAKQKKITISQAAFIKAWSGIVVFFRKTGTEEQSSEPERAVENFGWRWFLNEFKRYRSAFIYITISALCFSLLELATPLYFQIVIDKVLLHQVAATFIVVTFAVVVAIIFSSVFTFLREYILAFIANKIDLRLHIHSFKKLVHLPLQFFNARQVGVLVKHMQQISHIREFLLNQLFLAFIDILGLLIFFPILCFYSLTLTSIVFLFSALMAVVMALLIGPFRYRLQALYGAEGRKQSLLVEAIHGVDTIKSLGIEHTMDQKWNERSALSTLKMFMVQKVIFSATSLFNALERLSTVSIIATGTYLVMKGNLTVGALIAFQMIASRVSQPLVRMVNLIHKWQETSVSIKMLGDILDQKTEQELHQRTVQLIPQGKIAFENLSFHYPEQVRPALREINLTIEPGQILGIVGESGSGKSTLAKLLQGLYTDYSGRILLDDVDIRDLEPSYLRYHLGVVMQDNFLFTGTIAENITMKDPTIGLPRVIEACIVAGADEFIRAMPNGYFTWLVEGASNLSGGQRQRLAIARALVTQPRVLIFDEATSALDPDTEAHFRENLYKFAAGRTVIIITHRLSTIVDADQILVLKKGDMVGLDKHAGLLAHCNEYRKLWDRQYVAG